jgi:hypothetical protein
MKKVACLALVGALGLFGCGGGGGDDDDDISFPDAGDGPMYDAGGGPVCNAVSQTGCAAGEKCTYVLDDPTAGSGHLECKPDGTQGEGAACMRAAEVGAYDDCVAGFHCYNGTCRQICTTVNDTCAGECGDFVDGNGQPIVVEWCLDACDALLQDCPTENEACYLGSRGGICLRHDEVMPGQPCTYTNDCAEGSQCLGSAGSGTCRALCGTVDQIWGVDAMMQLTWPQCCGDCTALATDPIKGCAGLNELCWLIGDGAGGILTTGFCLIDTEAGNMDGMAPDWTCDCTRADPGDQCVEL